MVDPKAEQERAIAHLQAACPMCGRRPNARLRKTRLEQAEFYRVSMATMQEEADEIGERAEIEVRRVLTPEGLILVIGPIAP